MVVHKVKERRRFSSRGSSNSSRFPKVTFILTRTSFTVENNLNSLFLHILRTGLFLMLLPTRGKVLGKSSRSHFQRTAPPVALHSLAAILQGINPCRMTRMHVDGTQNGYK
jgi:hypothetical protein